MNFHSRDNSSTIPTIFSLARPSASLSPMSPSLWSVLSQVVFFICFECGVAYCLRP